VLSIVPNACMNPLDLVFMIPARNPDRIYSGYNS
jgi:hypothetical protein